MRNICPAGQRPSYPEPGGAMEPLFRKLHSQGVTEADEDKLLYLRDIMIKLHRARLRSALTLPT